MSVSGIYAIRRVAMGLATVSLNANAAVRGASAITTCRGDSEGRVSYKFEAKVGLVWIIRQRQINTMGIPSYFRKLVDNYKGLICRNKPGAVGWLMFDFNCLMYHVLRRPDCPAYVADRKAVWEAAFLDEIARYTLKVIRQAEPVRGVYIAIDGVAPMAKIKQQRMRRFKVGESASPGGDSSAAVGSLIAPPNPPSHGTIRSAGEVQNENGVGGLGGEALSPSWDKNALTPGTAFMAAVSARLQKLIRDHQPAGQRWLLSDTTEAGEGEQKIVAQMRAGLCEGSEGVVVYGLDADLIVLSLWTRATHMAGRPMWLFRERIERGEMVRNAVGEEQFEWFSIGILEDAVCIGRGEADRLPYLQDYCAAMMLLGNDFLPTSMTFRLKEGGHPRLLELVEKGRKAATGGRLWTASSGLDLKGWHAALQYLSYGEERRFKQAVEKKLMAKGNDTDPEDEPLRVKADAVFLDGSVCGGELVGGWRGLYAQIGFGGESGRREAVEKYIEGLTWIVDYYTGRPISMEWFYPWHFPPLWEDVAAGLKAGGWRAPPVPGARGLRPVEQLAMVLPLRSWGLIPAGEPVRRLPELAPEWFPEHYELQSIGKRFAWECEPEIPIPTPAQVWAMV
jgi:5'-3' exonuclease